MKVIATIILIILTFQAVFSQSTSVISVDYNRYYNNHSDFERKNGFSIAYEHEWKVKDYMYLKGGIKAKAAQEAYKSETLYYYQIPDTATGHPIVRPTNYTANGFVFGIQILFNVKTNLYDSKLYLLTGLNIGIEDLLTFTEYAGTDPEISTYYSEDPYPKSRSVGFGYNIGLLYEVTQRMGFFGEFTSTQNPDYTYNYVSLGLKIKVGRIEKEVTGNN